MEGQRIISIVEYFQELPDPRIDRSKRHDLVEIIVIAICTTIASGEGWEDMQEFGEAREEWLRRFLKLDNGIPSADTFRRVFERLDPEKFQECFISWVNAIKEALPNEVVAIDGKTLRRSFDKASKQLPIHLVNAWATENGLALGQVAVDCKSNEIKAIPKLLELLALRGCIVTIDAMGCQKDIALAIRSKGADYVLALKSNQGTLLEDVKDFFAGEVDTAHSEFQIDCHETVEKDHGRLEIRKYFTTSDIEWLGREADWKDLKSIGMVQSERTVEGKTTKEIRYYISSLPSCASKLGKAVRSHWGIENSLHWTLDVTFNEDCSRIRKDQAPKNLALVRKFALNLLKNETSRKISTRKKKKRILWEPDYMLKVFANSHLTLENQGN